MILFLSVFSCGRGDYVPDHDMVVFRLAPDGIAAWTRTIDTSFNDVAGDIAETPDGGFIIAGGSASRRYEATQPEFIRLARNGTVLSTTPEPRISGEFTSQLIARDGTLAASTVSLFDREGQLQSVTETGLSGVWSLSATIDGGIIVAGEGR